MADKDFKVKNGLTVNNNLIWANNGQIGFNTNSPDANVTIVGNANTQGNVAITGTLGVSNTISVTGIATFGNSVSTNGNIYTNGSIYAQGIANVQSSIYGFANLAIVGNTTLGNTLSVANNSLFLGPVTMNATTTMANNSNHNGPANFSNTITVFGYSNLVYNTAVGGTFISNGAATFSNSIAVTGNATFSNSVAVTGNVTFSNTLVVTGNVIFSNTINGRNVYEFLVANNSTPYNITGQFKFYNSITILGALIDGGGNSGGANNVLISNNGTVFWGPIGSASVTAPAANGLPSYASNTQIIFNDRGGLSSNVNITYNMDNYTFTAPVIVCSNGTLSLNATSSYFFSNGLISFGINNPTNKLHVVSSLNSADGIIVRNTNTGSSSQSYISLGTSAASGFNIGQNYSDKSAYINLVDNSYLNISANNSSKLYISANGNVGVGTTSPAYGLDISGIIRGTSEFISTSYGNGGQFRAISGNYGVMFRNDGSNFYLLSTASGSQYGSYNSLRPFNYNLGTGAVSIDGTGAGTTFGGTISSGAISSSGGLSGTTGTFSSTVSSTPGGSLGLNINGSSWMIGLQLNSGTVSRAYNDGTPRWNFEHRPVFAGNLALDAGNYNNYAPSKDGTGAYGNWNINAVGLTGYTINQNLGTGNSPTFSGLTTVGDIVTYRSGGTTGYHFLNSATTRYIGFDGSNYVMPSSDLYVNGGRVLTSSNYTGYNSWGGTGIYAERFYDYYSNGYFFIGRSQSRMSSVNLDVGVWNYSSEGWARILFNNSASTVYRGASTSQWVHEFQTNDGDTKWLMAAAGDFYAKGNVVAYWTSDIKFKENIKPLSNALSKINKINGVEFDWKDDYLDTLAIKDPYYIKKHDVGVIAQEIEEVLPQIVSTKEDGTKAVRYEKIVALLIQGIKELSDEVSELKKQVKG